MVLSIALLLSAFANLVFACIIGGHFLLKLAQPKGAEREDRMPIRDKMDEGFENIMNFTVDVGSGSAAE